MSIEPTPDTVRFRHGGDPISALDGERMSIGGSMNPLVAHAYTGYDLPENAPDPENAPEESLEENTTEE